MIKKTIYKLVEKGHHGNKLNSVFDYVIMILILLSIVSIVLESVSEINNRYTNLLKRFNEFTIIVFTIEYLFRIYVSDLTHPSNSRIKSALLFIFSAFGLVDLLAILPFYLPLIITMDLRFLRVIRLIRFLRILKINRYNNSLILIWTVMKEKRAELLVTGFLTILILILSSFIMYYVEGSKQPESFPNILATFWWAISALTTIGYGDIYPITPTGKFISGIIALVGIGLVALPTGIISAGFINKIDNNKQKKNEIKCPHCGKKLDI